jgi:septum formation protein
MKLKHPLVLISKSPRRQQILREFGLEFTIRTITVPEEYPASLPVEKIAGFLAQQKAEAFEDPDPDAMILAADTIVTCDGKVLGKPADEAEAAEMLSVLSGKSHRVFTGLCLRLQENYHTVTDCTEVFFRNISKKESEYYIHHFMPLDKAGAYGIQEWIGMIGITKIRGSYFNVVGLPVTKLYDLLVKLDLIEL